MEFYKVISALAISLFLIGCNTTPVIPKFPIPPAELMKPAPPLKKLSEAGTESKANNVTR
jgi:hypothetical protein